MKFTHYMFVRQAGRWRLFISCNQPTYLWVTSDIASLNTAEDYKKTAILVSTIYLSIYINNLFWADNKKGHQIDEVHALYVCETSWPVKTVHFM